MLYLDNPVGSLGGLLIYRDHANPKLFYYMAERPRIARSGGRPEFSFVKYRRDITDNPSFDPSGNQALGGGLLSFTVDLAVSDSTLQQVKQELQRTAGDGVTLAPIQFRSGTVRLSLVKPAEEEGGAATSGLTFFEEVMGATVPSLYGGNRATFSVVLSQEGSTFVEEALKGVASPVGILYELKTLAMRPAFQVHIEAEYKRIYDHFESQSASRTRVGRISHATEISTAFQRLKDEGSIKVEILHFTDSEDYREKAEAAFEWFKTELLKDFFQSSLQPPSFMENAAGQGLLAQLQTILGAFSTVQQNVSPTPTLGQPDNSQTRTTANAPQNQRDNVLPTSQINQAASQQQPAQGDQVESQSVYTLRSFRQEELKRRVFDYSMQEAVEWPFNPQGEFNTVAGGMNLARLVQEIDLDDPFFDVLQVEVSLAEDIEGSGIAAVTVDVEYPAENQDGRNIEHSDSWTFRPGANETKTFKCFLAAGKGLDWRYKVKVAFAADSPWQGKGNAVESNWRSSRSRQLVVDPFADINLLDIRVLAGELRPELVKGVTIRQRYQDVGHDLSFNNTLTLKPSDTEQSWKLRLPLKAKRSWSYQLDYALTSGGRVQTDWVETDSASIVVDDPFKDTLRIRIVPTLSASELAQAILQIIYEEPERGYEVKIDREFDPSNIRMTMVEIPTLTDEPKGFRYDLTLIKLNGSVSNHSGTSEAPVLVLGEGEGTSRSFNVKLVDSNLSAAGLVAVRVRLEGPAAPRGDAPPDSEEILFTPSQAEDRRVTLVQPPGATAFTCRWSVTGYTADGQTIPGQSGEERGGDLLVPLPRPR